METMPAPVVDAAVVMRLSRRRAIDLWGAVAALFTLGLILLSPAFDPWTGTGPVDYGGLPASALIDAGIAVAVWAPVVALAASQRAFLQPSGPREGVGWDQVTEVGVVATFLGQSVRLRLKSGRPVNLRLPYGSAWRRDRAFRTEVEFVRAYAVAHGAVPGPVRSRRFRTSLLSLVPVLLIAAVAGVRVVQRGAIWPWAPLATAPPACRALAPELEQAWPASQRRLLADEPTTCTWESIAGDSPYLTASVTITTESGGVLSNPVSSANQTYLDDLDLHRNASLTRLTGIGDEAFIDTSGPDDVAESRVANILVVVHLTRRGEPTGPGAAEQMLRDLVPRIRVE